MTVDFQNHFWGDKQNGFDVLYQNLKYGSSAVKELSEFLRSRSFLEEYNVNFLTKLSRKANNNSPQLGTFLPLWQILKQSTEKLSSVHMQTVQRLNQLIKEINKYCDEHHRKQKQIKNEEISTIEAINELKETITALNKAKEFYYSKTAEIEKLRRENASQKDIEKAESRMNKACVEYKNLIEKYRKVKEDFEKKFSISCQNFQRIEEDHIKQMKNYFNSYSEILESGHALMGQVYQEFRSNCQEMSSTKLLEIFIDAKGTGVNRPAVMQFEEASNNAINSSNLSNQISTNNNSLNKNNNNNSPSNAYSSALDILNLDLSIPANTVNVPNSIIEFETNKVDNINHLLPTNSNNRKDAGDKCSLEVPDIQIDLKSDKKSCSSTIDSLENVSPCTQKSKSSTVNQKDHHKSFPDIHSNTKTLTPKWFLRSRKDKSKDKKNKKIKDSDEESMNGSVTGLRTDYNEFKQKDYMVDSEGYTVRPTEENQNKEDSFYSSSDTDSEEEKEKKIFVKINPLPKTTQNSSVDQLIASAISLTLAPSNTQSRRLTLSSNHSPNQNENSQGRSLSQNAFKSKDSNDLFDLFSNQSTNNKTTQNDSKASSSFDAFNSNFVANKTNEPSNSTSGTVDRYAAFSELSGSSISENNGNENKTSATTPLNSTFNVLPLPPKSSESSVPPMNIQANSTIPKSISSTSFGGSSTNSFSVYKQPLYKNPASGFSNGMMSRAESIISLSSDFRMTPISICSSRDSSPLTISMSDTIPLALAFQESVGSCFKGTDENLSKISIIGCIKIAFSAGIIQVLTANPYLPQLTFRLKNANRLEKIILSKDLVEQVDSTNGYCTYEMNMNALQCSIKRLHDQSPNARYYNLDIIKYQVSSMHGAKNAPLQLVSHWKCDDSTTNLKIDFKYNSSAFTYSMAQPLKNVIFTTNIDSNVVSMVSQPFGKWDSLTKQATWKYNEISQTTENSGLGSIKAKFDISNGPCCPSSVYVQFSCQDTILSGLDFELLGSGYRLSLMKRQFCAGRYYCEPKIIEKP